MNQKFVTKRNGKTVEYNRQKIYNAILGASNESEKHMSPEEIENVTSEVETYIFSTDKLDVENIQDAVEHELMKQGFFDIAKRYIRYRQRHEERREAQKNLIHMYKDILFTDAEASDMKRDNANINTDASMGIMLKLGTESSKYFIDNYVLPEEFAKADKENYIHIHDKDFSLITLNCCQIDLLKLFRGGFSTGHGFLREPGSIRAYAALACIAVQSNQNEQFGGQSINCFDYAMAEGIRKSFNKAIMNETYRSLYSWYTDFRMLGTVKEFCSKMKPYFEIGKVLYTEKNREDQRDTRLNSLDYFEVMLNKFLREEYSINGVVLADIVERIYDLACMSVEEETHQAMEALIHNFNTLHSRAGSQVPFSSINYGMDISPEGRLATREVLTAIWNGLGHGETPIFPISVFQLKSGVNYDLEDPNYDLFKYACKVSAKRLFPNFLSLDSSFNLPYYKPGDYNSYVATMGCVDGDELVTYIYNGTMYCEGIKRLWLRVSDTQKSQGRSEYKKPVGLEIWDGDNGFVKVKTVIKNPDAGNWTRIKFSNGRSILATSDHPLYTENRGRIYVNQLEIGDVIRSYYQQPILESPDSINDTNLAYSLGLLITDGNYDKNVTVSLGVDEIDIQNKFMYCIKEYFGCECGITHYSRGIKGKYDTIRVLGDMKGMCKYLTELFGGRLKKDRSVPSNIFGASREVRVAFLAGMIDGDGHISHKSKVQIGSTNKELAFQQLAIAQSIGLPAKMYLNYYSSARPNAIRYRVEFSMTMELMLELASYKKSLDQWNCERSDTKIPDIVTVTDIEFIGALNKPSYDVETASDKFTCSFINSGNCRTRVMSNLNGPEESGSRGNFSFVTINLPMLALEAKGDLTKFWELYDKYIQLSHDYLLHRFEVIANKHVYNFPFLMGQGVWMGSDKLKHTDTIRDVLKHASYSIAYCGLAECLVALIGKHHGESYEAQVLGLEIIGHLREMTDKYAKEEKWNWTTFSAPAESTAGSFLRAIRKKFGVIPGVSDHDYLTNGNHVPVYYKIRAIDKIRIEAPYHALANAGNISYIEIDGDPLKNLTAFESIIRAMHDADMGYFSLNHPVDRDPVCGYTGIIDNECPHCHRREDGHYHFIMERPIKKGE